MVIVEKLVEWRFARETEVLGENLFHCRFVHHKVSGPFAGRNNHVCGCDENRNLAHPVTRKERYTLKCLHLETSTIQLLLLYQVSWKEGLTHLRRERKDRKGCTCLDCQTLQIEEEKHDETGKRDGVTSAHFKRSTAPRDLSVLVNHWTEF
jgi:hypothetical protein